MRAGSKGCQPFCLYRGAVASRSPALQDGRHRCLSSMCLQVQPGDLFITLWDAVPEEWINEVNFLCNLVTVEKLHCIYHT